MADAIPEEDLLTYTAHIIYPTNPHWMEGIDRALERFRSEMVMQR